MTAKAKINQSAEAQPLSKSSSALAVAERGEELAPPDSKPFPTPRPAARQANTVDKLSERAYIASLRRSIKQMIDGDVQPVREGLEELRRELDADVENNLMDK